MNIKAILVLLAAIAMQLVGSGQESLPEQFRGKPSRPAWWFTLMQCDLCVVASAVQLDLDRKERLLDSDNHVVAEYYPVKMNIDQILFISPRMTFDGRILKDSDSKFNIIPNSDPIKIFYSRVFSGSEGVVDAHFIGENPQLPDTAIFFLVKSNHKKGGEFLISGVSGVKQEDITRALAGNLPEVQQPDAQQDAPSNR